MGEKTLIKKAYQENLAMNSIWCKTIQTLNVVHKLHSRPVDTKEFPQKAKLIIKKNFINFWKLTFADRNREKKLSTYAVLKRDFHIDPYLNLPSFRNRQLISKFICSNHTLEIERGRFSKVPREDRKCSVCTLDKIEDEYHFLLECPAYAQIRSRVLQPRPILNSIEAVFTQVDHVKIGKYLKLAFKRREDIHEKNRIKYCVTKTSLNDMQLYLHKLNDTDKPYKPMALQPLRVTRDPNNILKLVITRKARPYKISNVSNNGMKLKLVRKGARIAPY